MLPVGIIVAVPVIIFYNFLVSRVNQILSMLENRVNMLVLLINAGNGASKGGETEES